MKVSLGFKRPCIQKGWGKYTIRGWREKNGTQFKNSASKAKIQNMLKIGKKKTIRQWKCFFSHVDVQSKKKNKNKKGLICCSEDVVQMLRDSIGKREAIK